MLAEELQESTSLKDFYFGPWARELSPKRPQDPKGHRAGPGALGPCLTVCQHNNNLSKKLPVIDNTYHFFYPPSYVCL